MLDANGKLAVVTMGSYGIGIERVLTCAIELFHDKDGIMLPPAIAPFTVVITPVNYGDALQRESADLLYARCLDLGIDAILDDRTIFIDTEAIGLVDQYNRRDTDGNGNTEVANNQ